MNHIHSIHIWIFLVLLGAHHWNFSTVDVPELSYVQQVVLPQAPVPLLAVSLPALLSRALAVQLLVAVLMMLLGRPGRDQIQRIKIRMNPRGWTTQKTLKNIAKPWDSKRYVGQHKLVSCSFRDIRKHRYNMLFCTLLPLQASPFQIGSRVLSCNNSLQMIKSTQINPLDEPAHRNSLKTPEMKWFSLKVRSLIIQNLGNPNDNCPKWLPQIGSPEADSPKTVHLKFP